MKTITYGPVTKAHLADASLFSGIEPTEFITDATIPVDPMVGGEAGVRQQHWRMVINAAALICIGENEHLLQAAEKFNLLIYQVDR